VQNEVIRARILVAAAVEAKGRQVGDAMWRKREEAAQQSHLASTSATCSTRSRMSIPRVIVGDDNTSYDCPSSACASTAVRSSISRARCVGACSCERIASGHGADLRVVFPKIDGRFLVWRSSATVRMWPKVTCQNCVKPRVRTSTPVDYSCSISLSFSLSLCLFPFWPSLAFVLSRFFMSVTFPRDTCDRRQLLIRRQRR